MTLLRLGVIADGTLDPLYNELVANAHSFDLQIEIESVSLTEAETELLDDKSKLRLFNPDVVLFFLSTQSVRRTPDTYSERIENLKRIVREKFTATVIQTLLPAPLELAYGNLESRSPQSLRSKVNEINSANREIVLDLADLASRVGLESYYDERLWFVGEIPFALNVVPRVAARALQLLRAMKIASVKCVVVDADNVLWGGLVAEDDSVEIGSTSPQGRAFEAFQNFLKILKVRGLLLALCSQNEESTVRFIFDSRTEMPLKLNDFAVVKINRRFKAENLAEIRKQLNLAYESIVFLDDEAFERNQIRSLLPHVIVPELPSDVASYVSFLSSLNLFETVSQSAEDKQRTDFAQQEALRASTESSYQTPEDFLQSLEMRAEVKALDETTLDRAVQLLERTNQFNLTTHRYGRDECRMFFGTPSFLVSLKDRFGDYGDVVLVLLKDGARAIHIDAWVMSCRVFKRTLEDFTLNEISRRAASKEIVGHFKPTNKNGLVRDLYTKFGFSADGDGRYRAQRLKQQMTFVRSEP